MSHESNLVVLGKEPVLTKTAMWELGLSASEPAQCRCSRRRAPSSSSHRSPECSTARATRSNRTRSRWGRCAANSSRSFSHSHAEGQITRKHPSATLKGGDSVNLTRWTFHLKRASASEGSLRPPESRWNLLNPWLDLSRIVKGHEQWLYRRQGKALTKGVRGREGIPSLQHRRSLPWLRVAFVAGHLVLPSY